MFVIKLTFSSAALAVCTWKQLWKRYGYIDGSVSEYVLQCRVAKSQPWSCWKIKLLESILSFWSRVSSDRHGCLFFFRKNHPEVVSTSMFTVPPNQLGGFWGLRQSCFGIPWNSTWRLGSTLLGQSQWMWSRFLTCEVLRGVVGLSSVLGWLVHGPHGWCLQTRDMYCMIVLISGY